MCYLKKGSSKRRKGLDKHHDTTVRKQDLVCLTSPVAREWVRGSAMGTAELTHRALHRGK